MILGMGTVYDLLNVNSPQPKAAPRPFHPELECPYCGQFGPFQHIGGCDDAFVIDSEDRLPPDHPDVTAIRIGIRRCVNSRCSRVVFFARERFVNIDELADRYHVLPAPLLQPDLGDASRSVAAAFQEATLCFNGGSYHGTVAMIRRTAEVFVREVGERNGLTGHLAKLSNLHRKLEFLKQEFGHVSAATLELFELIGVLKDIGNDGTHPVEKRYLVNQETAGAALEATAEMIRREYHTGKLTKFLEERRVESAADD